MTVARRRLAKALAVLLVLIIVAVAAFRLAAAARETMTDAFNAALLETLKKL
jgi:hypothetical protein